MALICWPVAGWLLATACNPAKDGSATPPEQYISDENSVGFDIESIDVRGPELVYLATYTANGKTARFRIELNPSKALDDKATRELRIKSGKGRFVAERGSDASILLADLKKALEAKVLPSEIERATDLSFTFVSFGDNQSQASGGGFNANPPGNWTPMKLFIGEGEHECEFFLNLNPVIKKGQFSIKDPDYGDEVVQQLAKVL